MRLSSNVFLVAYAIFLVFGIGFVIFSSDSDAINNLICAVSVASASISLADLFYSKVNIDKQERIQLTTCYLIAKHKSNFYFKQIEKKYGGEAELMISRLMQVFSEDEIEILLTKKLTTEQKEMYSERIRGKIKDDDEAKELLNLINSEFDPIGEEMSIVDHPDEDGAVAASLQIGKKREKRSLYIANAIAILGLTIFLIILAWNGIFEKHISTLNNVLTILAFLTVVLNFLLKDNYRAKSLQEIEAQKKELYNL